MCSCIHVDPPEHVPFPVKMWYDSCSDFKLSSKQLEKKVANSLLDSPEQIAAVRNLFQIMFMFWAWTWCFWLWCSWGIFKIDYWFNHSPYNCVQNQSGTSNWLNFNQFASIKYKNPILYMKIICALVHVIKCYSSENFNTSFLQATNLFF